MYRPIAFLGFRRMARLVMTGKADIISFWDNAKFYMNVNLPSVIILKKYVRRQPVRPKFNFRGVFKRDLFTCCYTGKPLPPSQLTVDHVIPKSRGGQSTWENCVTASLEINSAKGNKTPDEAGLKLIKKPTAPSDSLALEYVILTKTHPDWALYFPDVVKRKTEH